jgi:hypothetical protein
MRPPPTRRPLGRQGPRVPGTAWLAPLLTILLLCAPPAAQSDPAPGGATIPNRAEAEFQPAPTLPREVVYSNEVTVEVAAVESLTLTAEQRIATTPGEPVALPHLLTNTGNVDSSYRLSLVNLAGDGFDLGGLQLVLDLDRDGVADPGEPVLPADGATTGLSLAVGESAALLVLGTVPMIANGQAILTLAVSTTSATPASASNTDIVSVDGLALVAVAKQADRAGPVLPGTTVGYRITLENGGGTPAGPVAQAGPAGAPIQIDGSAATVFLVSDVLPAGVAYVPGSLASSLPGELKLFRLAGDPAGSYRTSGEDGDVVEIAVGSREFALAPGGSIELRFEARVRAGYSGPIVNVARSVHDDGAGPAAVDSAPVILESLAAAIGLAKRADVPVLEADPTTGEVQSARVTLSFMVENLGETDLEDVQVEDLLEGSGRFGVHTGAEVPGPGEYALVAGSAAVTASGGASGAVSPGYDGTSGATGMLAPGATLPAGAALEISFDVRFGLGELAGPILNTAMARGRPTIAPETVVEDASVDGLLPDANGNGDAGDDDSPTSIGVPLPRIAVDKAASLPERLPGAERRYRVAYTITVSNVGAVPATFVRVIDNLRCTFRPPGSPAAVTGWRLVAAPVAERGLLAVNTGFTGDAPCDEGMAGGTAPRWPDVPAAIVLTDGTRHLAAGEAEVIRFSVEFELDPLAPAAGRSFDNLAWATASDAGDAAALVLASARDDALAVPVDPSGVVYDALERVPVAGATVTLIREDCDGAGGPITAEQLAAVPGVTYRFNADGSVSMTTASDGAYSFVLLYPPVASTCRYRLAVTPPPGGRWRSPSVLLPAEPGIAPGGLVQPQSGPPTGSDATTHFLRFELGPALPEVLNNHVPLDPILPPASLVLEKTGSRTVMNVGQGIDYVLRLGLESRAAVGSLRVVDRLPAGFRFLAGSARLDGAAIADPAGAPGPELTFELPPPPAGAPTEFVLSYRAIAGLDAPLGAAINRAVAYTDEAASNEAAWRVDVEGGVFSEEAYLIGKVFLDTNRDGVQGHEEVGVPGVRLLLEDGTSVVTDVEGKYSLYGLRAITHVLKLDATTLPEGAQPLVIDNRNSGRADSRFVDLKKGELHKANFAIEDCCSTGVREEVERRRKALAMQPEAEGEAVSRARLELGPEPEPTLQETRSRGATGELTPEGARAAGAAPSPRRAERPVEVYEPMLPAEATRGAPSRSATPAMGAARAAIEPLLEGADNAAGFVGVTDGDTLPVALTDVVVKGRLGSELQLTVNGRAETARRVGRKLRDAARQLEAWQYVGVQLVAGDNVLELAEVDPFGNARNRIRITLVAPGEPGRVEVEAPRTAPADPGKPVVVQVRVVDDRGVPVTVRTPVTLETTAGRFDLRDLNPDEPGLQAFVTGGEARFELVPPGEPEDGLLRVSSGSLSAEAPIAFLPELRPLIGVGILEGIIDLRGKGLVPMGRARGNAFEQELRNLSRESDDGRRRAAGRAAFYLKGTVRGDYLLTAAFDSDKSTQERLFRDIQPDRFYPIYGDSAEKGFDAQSTQRLYLRIDRDRSWLLYGDFASEGTDEVRRLGAYNRALTGLKLHHEDGRVSANVFGSHDNLRQVVLEFPADGTSGPYQLGGAGELYENSERVEILVRDRNQPALVLETLPQTRFVDYVIEPVSRRLLFKAPVASVDANLNPRWIRVTYESDQGGPSYWTAGADARVKVAERLELGASVVRDDNPDTPATLVGATAVLRPTDGTALVAEVAGTDTAVAGDGLAGRLEWIKQDGDLRVRAQVTGSDRGFDNASAGFTAGRTEATLLATYAHDERTVLRAEAQYSRDRLAGGERSGALLTASRRLESGLTAEAGLRASRETDVPADATGAGPTRDGELLALRARVASPLPDIAGSLVFLEAEQDVRESERRMVAAGGEYQLGAKTRLFGRYEFLSSLGNPYALNDSQQNNLAVLGIESAYLEQGRAFSELRLRDGISGREGQAASGVRNGWLLREGLWLGASLEHTAALGGVAGNRSAAATTSLEYTGSDRYKAYGSLEVRDADSGDAWLNTLGLSVKLDKDWSLLTRSAVSLQREDSAGSRTLLSRQQIGFAWRQVDYDRFNALGRYEYELRDVDGVPGEGREATHVVSLHGHYQHDRALAFSSRYAFMWGRESSAGFTHSVSGHLVYGRALWDFAKDWDLSLQAARRFGPSDGGSHALGLELGHQLMDNLWLSIGHNVEGFDQPALAGAEELNRGTYARIRFKFDEGLRQ